jgi:hypothetical protein
VLGRKSTARAARRRELLKANRQLAAAESHSALVLPAAPNPSSIIPDSAVPISKAEMRSRINEWIESRELLVPPPRPNTFEGVRFRRAVSAGIKAGILEAAAAPSK